MARLKDTEIYGDLFVTGVMTANERLESLGVAEFTTKWDIVNWWTDGDGTDQSFTVVNSDDNKSGAVLTIKSKNSVVTPRGWGLVAASVESSLGDGNFGLYNNNLKKFLFKVDKNGNSYTGIDATDKIWTEGNDGPGSGLDADKLDGLDSTRYLKFYFPHSYDWQPSTATKTLVGSYHPTLTGDGYISIGATGNAGTNSIDLYLDGDFYAKENKLVWHQGNDGIDSGLDADLLDGLHAKDFALTGHTHSYLTSGGRLAYLSGASALPQTGLSMAENYNSVTPGYPAMYGNILNLKGSVSVGCNQVLFGWSGSSTSTSGVHEHMYYRSKRDSADALWSDWAKVWSDKNHGSGSGLNADLLDGKHLNELLLLTGGTMTGDIIFSKTMTGLKWVMNSDGAEIFFKNDSDADTDSYLCFKTLDNGNEYFKWVMRSSSTDTEKMRLNGEGLTVTGNIHATKIFGAVYNDYAEYFEKADEIEPGDVVELDLNSDDEVYIKSSSEYSKTVVGVCSDEYYQCIGGNGDKKDEENFTPIGLAGRVRVKVIGKVNKGEFLVSSKIPGIAMAVTDAPVGTIIGKAVENKLTEEIERVRMLIQLH